jgi:hypothetical protein
MNASLDQKDALKKAERIRASAIDSFNWIDSNEVIRKGLHSRSRPPKLEMINEGTTVYVHQPPLIDEDNLGGCKTTSVGMAQGLWCAWKGNRMCQTASG